LKGALEAFFQNFLCKTVKLWVFSPLLRSTDTIRHCPPDAKFQSYESMKYKFLLLQELQTLDQAQRVKYLDCLDDTCTTAMPKVNEITFRNGVRLPFSTVDLVLVLQLNQLLRSLNGGATRSKQVSGSMATAAADAFCLHDNIVHYLPLSVSEPVVSETSPFMTQKRLEEHKALRDFLFGVAGGIRLFHIITIAQRNILTLLYRSMGSRLFMSKTFTQAAEFANFQRRRYAMHIFNQWVRGSFHDYVEAATKGDFVEVHERALQIGINKHIAQKVEITQAIIKGTVEYVNDWKNRFNKDHPGGPPCQASQENIDQCQYFVDATGEMLLAITMNQLSSIPFPIVIDRVKGVDARFEQMKRNLESVSSGPLFAGIDVQNARDTLDEVLIIAGNHLMFLLRRASVAFRAAFENNNIKFGSGDQFMLFLEIESFLQPVIASKRPATGDPTWTRRFLCAVFDGEEPFYFRACLAKALQSLMLLTNVRNTLFVDIAEVGNPIDRKIADRFRNLCLWFEMKTDLIPI
jgi:hypothetical protein